MNTVLIQLANAQNEMIDRDLNVWLSNTNKYYFSPKTFVSADFHVRITKGLKTAQLSLLRSSFGTKVNDQLTLGAGYSFISIYSNSGQPNGNKRKEHDIWERLTIEQKINHFDLRHRFIMEHRFIQRPNSSDSLKFQKKYGFNQRFRYKFSIRFPIKGSERILGEISNETLLTLNNVFMPVDFNQNRLLVGVTYKYSKYFIFKMGYLQQVIKKADNVSFESNPTLFLSIGINFYQRQT